jgi:hypothetical protein
LTFLYWHTLIWIAWGLALVVLAAKGWREYPRLVSALRARNRLT